jgi:hypothetical protein
MKNTIVVLQNTIFIPALLISRQCSPFLYICLLVFFVSKVHPTHISPEDGSIMFLQNDSLCQQDFIMSQPERPQSEFGVHYDILFVIQIHYYFSYTL